MPSEPSDRPSLLQSLVVTEISRKTISWVHKVGGINLLAYIRSTGCWCSKSAAYGLVMGIITTIFARVLVKQLSPTSLVSERKWLSGSGAELCSIPSFRATRVCASRDGTCPSHSMTLLNNETLALSFNVARKRPRKSTDDSMCRVPMASTMHTRNNGT